MARYPALIDGEKGAYGATFPDLPGIVAMGASVDEVLVNAEEALRDYVIAAEEAGGAITPPTPMERMATPAGCTLVSVRPPVLPSALREVKEPQSPPRLSRFASNW